MHKNVFIAASTLAMAVAAVPADGAIITYDVSGIFADGRALSGSFAVDDSGTGTFNQVKNVKLSIDGFGLFSNVGGASFSGPATTTGLYGLQFFDDTTFSMMLGIGFVAKHDNFKILSIANQPLTLGSFYSKPDGTSSVLASGTISASPVAAIPEPNTWVMMLFGFGMVGATARYRRRSVATTYA